jgi:hypothetical protein
VAHLSMHILLGPALGVQVLTAGAVAAGLAVMYVMDAIRASGERQGAWESPQHI